MTENGGNHTFTRPLSTVWWRDARPEVIPPGQVKDGLMGKLEMGIKLSLTCCFFPEQIRLKKKEGGLSIQKSLLFRATFRNTGQMI